MLGSISPVGERSRNQRWWLTATAYTVGSVLAGAALGAILGAGGRLTVGAWSSGIRVGILGAALIVAVLADGGVLGLRVPSWHRQVDERWLTTYRGWVYGAGFGLLLGVAVATIVPSAVTYAALAATLLTADWRWGLVIGATFGAVRSMPLLLAGGLTTADRLYTAMRRVAGAEGVVHRATMAAQAVIATALLTATAVVR